MSVHELVFKSLGGKVSLENSVTVCGSGTTGCHGYLQSHEIDPIFPANGNKLIIFLLRTRAARLFVAGNIMVEMVTS